MKWLIVNADDFGASRGITRGIIEAHREGILTSTSLMVNMPWSEQAAKLSQDVPALSIGLHVQLTSQDGQLIVDPTASRDCRAELHRQFCRFQDLMGSLPTHIDSHHNVHRDARLLPHFLEWAQAYRLPLREHSVARYFPKFYGQWNGEMHLEQISEESLLRMLKVDIGGSFTELSCHPGYADSDFRTTYSTERETELRTLCAPSVRRGLEELNIQLIDFRDLRRLAVATV